MQNTEPDELVKTSLRTPEDLINKMVFNDDNDERFMNQIFSRFKMIILFTQTLFFLLINGL